MKSLPTFALCALVLALPACSSSSGSTATTTDSGATTDTDTDTGTGDLDSGDDAPSSACGLKASCVATDKSCVGLVDNTGLTKFGLRMSEIDLTSPPALTAGIFHSVFAGSTGLDLPVCNQNATGTVSWLLQFDTTAMTLKLGGAKPVATPTDGYAFVDAMIGGAHVQPATFSDVSPDAMGRFAATTGVDLVLPIFLDAASTSSIVLPLHQARISTGTLSSHNDCIGTYNAAGLDPANSCTPDSTHPAFLDAGSLEGFMTLEEADKLPVAAINQSLCVLLSGNATMYGVPSAMGVTVCKRDASGQILFQGDWCSTTNLAASGGCADASQLRANFAAGSVKILN